MQGESEKDMEITVNEFLGMALDDTFDFSIYDLTKNAYIFKNSTEEEMPDEIGDMYVESWNMSSKRGIELNVNSDE